MELTDFVLSTFPNGWMWNSMRHDSQEWSVPTGIRTTEDEWKQSVKSGGSMMNGGVSQSIGGTWK